MFFTWTPNKICKYQGIEQKKSYQFVSSSTPFNQIFRGMKKRAEKPKKNETLQSSNVVPFLLCWFFYEISIINRTSRLYCEIAFVMKETVNDVIEKLKMFRGFFSLL